MPGTIIYDDMNNSSNLGAANLSTLGFWQGAGYINGNSYAATSIGHLLTTYGTATAVTTGTLYFYPFYCNNLQAFTKIAVLVFSGTVNYNLGIYNSSNSQPTGDPIPGSTSGSVGTAFTFATPITLQANTLYWLAVTADSSANTVVTLPAQTTLPNTCGSATRSSAAANQIIGWTQSFVYNTTLPTVGSLTARTEASVLHLLFLQV